MARFDVYRTRRDDLALDVQSNFVPFRNTRVVVPLLRRGVLPIVADLTPVFAVDGEQRVMATHLLFSALSKDLGPPVTSLAAHQDDITRALDVLLTGF